MKVFHNFHQIFNGVWITSVCACTSDRERSTRMKLWITRNWYSCQCECGLMLKKLAFRWTSTLNSVCGGGNGTVYTVIVNDSIVVFHLCITLYSALVKMDGTSLLLILQVFYERCRLIYVPQDFHMSWQEGTSICYVVAVSMYLCAVFHTELIDGDYW